MPERLLARHGADALRGHLDHAVAARAAADVDTLPLPPYVASFLAQLRLGHGIPFSYLVPDQALLPDNSIRFFSVDEDWMDAACAGALAVGTASSRDTEHLQAATPRALAAVRGAVPLMAAVRRRTLRRTDVAAHIAAHVRAAPAASDDAAAPITGFLMRSPLVSGWPGFSVRAFTTTAIPAGADPSTVSADQVVPILRMELLAPSVLIVLFSGSPALVWIEEPHHGIQLGLDNPTGNQYEVDSIPVPMRPSGRNVVDVGQLAAVLGGLGPADLATQLLRPPWRQRFE
jgi:hypothetical protein